MQSNVTVSSLSALCISSFSSAGSKRRSGTRHPDNEKMRGTEAMKGNIPSNMPHSSLFGPPLPLLCPPSNLSTSIPRLHTKLGPLWRTGSWTGSLLSPSQGKWVWDVCLEEGGHFPNYEPKSNWQPCSRDPRESTGSENPEHNGVQTWKPALSRWAKENMWRSLKFSNKK